MVEIGQYYPKFHHDFKNDLSCGATRPGEAVPAHRIGIASNRDRVLGILISILEKRLVSVSSTSDQVGRRRRAARGREGSCFGRPYRRR